MISCVFFLFALLYQVILCIWAMTCDFRQCGILASVDLEELVQPPFKLRNFK